MDPVRGLDGPAAPPRDNGELVFDAPWQGRAFGIAVALADAGVLPWEAFRAALVEEVRATPGGADYWSAWTRALARAVDAQEVLDAGEIESRAAAVMHAHAAEHAH
jgi:nitrile hydratase accessory protein